jgi:NADPH:quinone reductase-like Zn-dependent oxidoreductase
MSKVEAPLGRVVQFDRYGGPETLKIGWRPRPVAGPGEILVRVHATALNPKDAMIRSGALRLQSGRTFPRGTGFDVAGEVAATGPGVADLEPGGRVWGFLDGTMGGAAADYVVIPRSCVARMPARLGWTEGAALPLVATAALQALRNVARLAAGERVLIRGASGGVGSAAIQIARSMGAEVTAVTRAGGLAHCSRLGADEVVDRPSVDPATLGRRFDVYLDCVGGSSLRAYTRLLVPGGRWVTVAPSVPIFALTPVSPFIARFLRAPGFGFVVVRPSSADLEELGRLVGQGKLHMPVQTVYPLEDIRRAHQDLAHGGGLGKRVVVVSPEATVEACGAGPREVGHAGAA